MQKTGLKINKNNKWWLLFLAAFAAVYMLLVQALGHVGVLEQLSFLAAQVGFVLVPGMALLLLIGPPEDRVRFGITAYLLGFCMVVAEYFVFYALGLKDVLWAPMLAVTALSLWGIWRKRETFQKMEADGQGGWAFCALAAALLLAVLFQVISINNTPDITGKDLTVFYQDLTWNMGNVTSLASGMPVMDIHIMDFTYGYHYLSAAFLAVFKNLLGTTSFVLYMKLMPVVQVFVMAGGLYLLFSLLFKNKWAAVGAAGLAALCALTTVQHMLWYAFATPVGVGFSVAAASYFIRYMKKMEQTKGVDRDFLLYLVFLALASGTKSPYALAILAGPGIVLLVQLFRRKNVKQVLLAGVLMAATFGAVYMALVYGIQAFNHFQQAFAAELFMYPPQYYTAALAQFPSMPQSVVRAMVYPIYMILNYAAVFAALVGLLVWLLRSKGKDRKLALFLFFGIFAGFMVASMLYQPGLSNLFFMDAVIPLSVFALFWLLKQVWGSAARKAAKVLFACALAALFAWSCYANLSSLYVTSANEHTRQADIYNSISKDEYEGLVWMRENTPKDAVFLSDRQFYTPDEILYNARYYYYTAFAERTCYLEGYNYVSTRTEGYEPTITEREGVIYDVYEEQDPAAIERVIGEGVDYIVVTYWRNPGFWLDEEYGDMVFQNNGMTIYELKQ